MPTWDEAEQGLARCEGLTEKLLRAVRHGYLAACSEVDHHVGRLLEALDRLGRAENTLVLFVSDHGERLGDHARLAKGYPADDPVSRAPLIARWPAAAVAGHVEDHVVELLDVLPTVLQA